MTTMAEQIPQEARERAETLLKSLDSQLAPLFEQIEDGSNSAVVFRVPEDAA
jgi:hypothetical protein